MDETIRKAPQVFLSHTKADKSFVLRLAGDLEKLGFRIWLNEWELRVGDSLVGSIEKGIDESTWMIVVLSPDAVASRWLLKELRAGLVRETEKGTVFVLPALYRDTNLPAFLRDKFYADFTQSYENGLCILRDRLVGDYSAKKKDDSWFLVRNPLGNEPLEVLSKLMSDKAGYGAMYTMVSPNMRGSLRLFSRMCMLPDLATKVKWPGKPVLKPVSELWFGESGRLLLRREGKMVHGDYDWYGMSLVGKIEGRETDGIITFEWSWSVSSEKGRGIFWTDVPNVLHGGWWMDFAQIDESRILQKKMTVPYKWEFVRMNTLKIEYASDESISHPP